MLNGESKPRPVWTVSLLVGGFILAGSITAGAADFGGDCCADLEERIAELEATTARKGNRKVSLSVYGKVNQAVMFWDDGDEDNAYVVTNDSSRTRIGLKGKAKISSNWSAYYKIELGIRTANSKRSNQFDPTASNQEPDLRHSEWGLKSKTWGKFGVGLQKNITKDITKMNLAGTGDVGKYSDAEDSGGGFFLVAKGQSAFADGTQWRRLIARTGSAPGEGERINAVTYYTPSWHGFQIGAVWGGDDAGGIGALYKNKFGSVKVKAGIAYQQNTSNQGRASLHGCPGRNAGSGSPIPNVSDADCDAVGGSIAIMDTIAGCMPNLQPARCGTIRFPHSRISWAPTLTTNTPSGRSKQASRGTGIRLGRPRCLVSITSTRVAASIAPLMAAIPSIPSAAMRKFSAAMSLFGA